MTEQTMTPGELLPPEPKGIAERAKAAIDSLADHAISIITRQGAEIIELRARVDALESELTQLCNTIEGCGLGDLPPELEAGVSFARGLLARAEGCGND